MFQDLRQAEVVMRCFDGSTEVRSFASVEEARLWVFWLPFLQTEGVWTQVESALVVPLNVYAN